MAGSRYDGKVIEQRMSETPPGEVWLQYQQSRGIRAYVNCGDVAEASDYEANAEEARDGLAVKLILSGVDMPGLTD